MEIVVKGAIVLIWFAGIATMAIGVLGLVWLDSQIFAKVAFTGAVAFFVATMLTAPIDELFK